MKRAHYLKQYEDAFRTILAEKTFWFRTVSANTNVPDTTWITGVLTFDGIGSVRLEKDLVRSGAAVVRHRDEAAFTESFRDDYRDELLRLEGMARLEKKGVWASE